MCGIAGLISLGGSALPSESQRTDIGRMLRAMRHRGPDREAAWGVGRVSLGSTWLKIMDSGARASLPLANDDGSVVLAYNGEVTNFRELRAHHRLDERFEMRSNSDAEVLLRFYETRGIGCLEELTGMFAFALIDLRARRAWLVRDFFGLRPLYTLRAGDRLWFASEIDALRTIPDFHPELDLEGFHHFLGLGYFPGERTPFAAIRELRAGRLIEIDLEAGSTRERRYFRPHYDAIEGRSDDEVASALRDAMRDSVARNLVSEAPLGLTLSGGIDTTSILALARDIVGPRADLHTFSIEMDEPSFDESRWQRMVVARYGPTHHAVRIGPAMVASLLETHMRALHEPT